MRVARSIILFLLLAAGFQYLGTLTSGCAQIMRPTGGPKDTLPPKLLSVSPENGTVNFKGKRITMEFDEYIQLDNPFQNVLFSPLPKKTPFVDFRMKTVTVRLYDTLKENKTYSIQFGRSIKDLNEGNPFGNYSYVFSTGPTIDSSSIRGKVFLAETGTIDTTLTILLRSDISDSAVYKRKPDYIARLDSSGGFRIPFLSSGTYYLFALKDEGGQFTYNSKQTMFAFASDSIVLEKGVRDSVTGVRLYAYEQEEPEENVSTAPKKDTLIKYTNNLDNGKQSLIDPLLLTFSDSLKMFDSAKITLADTNFNAISGVTYQLDSTGKVLSLNYQWPEKTEYRLIVQEDAVADTNDYHLAKTDTVKVTTKEQSDYGTLKLNFTNLDIFKNPVIQLVKDKKIFLSGTIVNDQYEVNLLPPGAYTIRILEDINGNEKWDPGNYEERLQPEIVHRLDEEINVRANWDNERDIDAKVMEEPAPPKKNTNPQRGGQPSLFGN